VSVTPTDDGPASRILDVLDDIARANGGRDRRFRLDGSHIVAADLDRLASLNVVALFRPGLDWTSTRELIDKGVRIALGSGWPSAPLNPMLTLAAATSEGVTTAQALAALTSGSSFAEFQDPEKGIIARGQRADMVILSDDILSLPPSRIKDVRVLATIAGGKVVHQRKP
jgi:predicted amidohydrolase YtcJ